ncbi:MAG: GreA/GreB family elongation factor [Spirochaetes bacterium]|nr:GreA/GreB family elongation factor [Spirochaetota bacterium]
MSRAFVSESDAEFQDDDVPEIKVPLPPGVKNYMTPEGADRLRAELHNLVHIERPKIAAKLSRTVTDINISDREAMSCNRRRIREIDRRMEYLTKMVDIIEVVTPGRQDPDRVLFGAIVKVREEDGGEQVYQIVGVDESSPSEGRVSWISPIAKALISARVGDVVTLRLSGGNTKLTILKVEYR